MQNVKPNPFLPQSDAEKYVPYLEYSPEEIIAFVDEVLGMSTLDFNTKFDYLVFNTLIFGAPIDEVAEAFGVDLVLVKNNKDTHTLKRFMEILAFYAEYESEKDDKKARELEEKIEEVALKYNFPFNVHKLREFKEAAAKFHQDFEEAAVKFMRELLKSL